MEPCAPARVLMLHGLLSGRCAWDRLRARLDPAVEVTAPDLLGYGDAIDHPHDEYGLEEVVSHLLPVLEETQPTHVLGHSMGGIVALALAGRFPGRFARIGLIGLPIYETRPDGMDYLHRRGLLHRAILHTDCLSHYGCDAMYAARHVWTPLGRVFARRQPREHLHAAFRHSRASHSGCLDRIIFADLVPALAANAGDPVVALHGDRDPSARLDRVRALTAERGWALDIAAGASHQVMIERPGAVARWVERRLLARGPQ